MNNVSTPALSASDQVAISFVPAIIRKKYSSAKQRDEPFIAEDHAALLFIDICNFSPLCNRLMKDNVNGVERITEILHDHYDFVLSVIAGYGGQPLFFAGDGLMSAWPGDKATAEESVRLAASCARKIISERATAADDDNLLSLHAIVSVGPWQMTELDGVHGNRLYSFFGDVFSTLTLSSKNKAPNEVLISNGALACLKEVKSRPVKFETSVLLHFPFSSPKAESPEQEFPEEAAQALRSFVPHTLAFPLNRERLEWIAETRPVTILYVRLSNNGRGPSANLKQLHESVSAVRPLVEECEGLMNQVWVDEKDSNILICFGPPPSAHNDNPERSVRLAFEIRDLLRAYGIDNSIGVCTGMAYCGILGNDHLRQYTVIGDVVNLSAHITGLNKNTVYCDRATFLTSNKAISYTGPVQQQIKGRSEPVPLYVPERLIANDTGRAEYAALIGREAELALLTEAFNGASGGESVCVIVEGENGMGKTMLLEAFMAKHASGNGRFFFGNGDFLSRNTPYSVMGTIFSSLLGLQNIAALKNHKEILQGFEARYGSKASLLNAVLQSDFPDGEETKNLTAGQRVIATHGFLLHLVERETVKHPVVFIIDDAQWMDETTWNLIESVNATLNRCLVVLSFCEADEMPRVKTHRLKNTIKIELKELADADQEKIISAKLGVQKVSAQVAGLIKRIAKGNPFFCAELAGSLQDRELLLMKGDTCFFADNAAVDALSLPETVRGALRRRIDGIDPGSQLSLKVASVVGNRFPSTVVRNIYPIDAERVSVSAYLKDAKTAGFISDMMVDKLDGYHFNSATIADVAYEMTLSEQKRLLHRKTAEWYESHFKEDLHPFYVQLAHHWTKAGEKKKAAAYHEKEAVRLFRLGFVKQALHVGLEGVSILGLEMERDPAPIGQKIGEHLGAIQSFMSGRTIESLLLHKKLEDGNTEMIIRMLLELSPLAHVSQQAELFALMSISCMRFTLEQGNGGSAAEVYSMYSILHKSLTGDGKTAFAWSNLAMAVDHKAGHTLQSRVYFIHCWFIAHWVVPVRQLISLAEQGAEAGLQSGDVTFGCFNLSLCVILKAMAGIHLDDVIETAQVHSLRNNGAVVNAAFHLMHEEQVAKAFQGRTTGYTSLTDEKYDEGKNIASICATDMYNQIGVYFVSKLKLAAHFGNWDEAIAWGDKAFPLLPAFANQTSHVELEMYYTLACLYRASETDGGPQCLFTAKAGTGVGAVQAWACLCPENFLHKALLLDAVREGFAGNTANATQLFAQAAEGAAVNGFMQDRGLSFEHLARMQKRTGADEKQAVRDALDAYAAWGADGKIAYLRSEFGV